MNLKAEKIGIPKINKEEGMAFRIVDADSKDPLLHDIAIVYHKPMMEDCERIANLIAAAPELLEALKESVKHNADILDNLLFPNHGYKSLLTPDQIAWRKKVQEWQKSTRAIIQTIEESPCTSELNQPTQE